MPPAQPNPQTQTQPPPRIADVSYTIYTEDRKRWIWRLSIYRPGAKSRTLIKEGFALSETMAFAAARNYFEMWEKAQQ